MAREVEVVLVDESVAEEGRVAGEGLADPVDADAEDGGGDADDDELSAGGGASA